jgi:hypothetical protein
VKQVSSKTVIDARFKRRFALAHSRYDHKIEFASQYFIWAQFYAMAPEMVHESDVLMHDKRSIPSTVGYALLRLIECFCECGLPPALQSF